MIVFEGVSKTFHIRHARSLKQTVLNLIHRNRSHTDRFAAITDLSFSVNPGESVALMGRNGSGKSTSLKLLSGVMRPTTGWIRVRGRIAGLLEVGAGFHPDLSGRENIYLNAAILGMSKEETDARLNDIIEFSEIGEFIDTEVKRYSSGMYARLGFAVAIHAELDVLLVDEVLSVGDAEFREKCNLKLRELQAQGKTMFIVSHSAAQVRKLCTRGIVLDHGKMIYDGPIAGALDLVSPKRSRTQSAPKVASQGFKKPVAAKIPAKALPTGEKKQLVAALPTVVGRMAVGWTVAAVTGTWGPAPVAFSFQWLRNGEKIRGGSTPTYQITREDAGASIAVRVRGQKIGFTPVSMLSEARLVPSDGESPKPPEPAAAQQPASQPAHAAHTVGSHSVSSNGPAR